MFKTDLMIITKISNANIVYSCFRVALEFLFHSGKQDLGCREPLRSKSRIQFISCSFIVAEFTCLTNDVLCSLLCGRWI